MTYICASCLSSFEYDRTTTLDEIAHNILDICDCYAEACTPKEPDETD